MASLESRRSGYTLLELVIVMAIIVMISAMAYPALDNYYGSFKVIGAADSLKSAWAQGRARAIEDGTNYRVAVVPGTTRYRVAPDSPEFWNGNTPEFSEFDNPPFIFEGSFPKGVLPCFEGDPPPPSTGMDNDSEDDQSPVDSGSWVTIAQLLPDGTATLLAPDGTTRDEMLITLTCKGSGPVRLRVRGLTGTIKSVSNKEDR